MRHVGNEGTGVEVAAQASCREDNGHAIVVELLGEVVDELRTLADVLHVEALIQALCHGLHSAYVHTTVGEEALVEGDVLDHHLGELLILTGDDTALSEAELAG